MKFNPHFLLGMVCALVVFSTTSCNFIESKEEPTACFKALSDSIVQNEPVKFTNCSQLASYYHWDFGDGTFSSEENPTHTFEDVNDFQEVRLTAINENGNENNVWRVFNIQKRIPTQMVIHSLILNYNLSYGSYDIYDLHDGTGPDLTFNVKSDLTSLLECPYSIKNCDFGTPYTFDQQAGFPLTVDISSNILHIEVLDDDGNNAYELIDEIYIIVNPLSQSHQFTVHNLTGERVSATLEVSWVF